MVPGGVAALSFHSAHRYDLGMTVILPNPVDAHVLTVHAAPMHTGQVLFFAGSGNDVPNYDARLVRSIRASSTYPPVRSTQCPGYGTTRTGTKAPC